MSPSSPKAGDPALKSDEEILSHYRDQQRPEDFHELVRRYSAQLGRYLGRYLGSPDLAEDVLQDTFFQVHSKCSHYGDDWPARPWLYSVATHRAIDALRRSKRRRAAEFEARRGADEPDSLVETLADAGPGPLQRLQDEERRQWVRESITRLPESMQQTLLLAYDRELPYAEIADLMGIPIGTVKSRLHNAIGRLREMADRDDQAVGR